jgi:uncharacterized protein YueI
MSTRKKSQNSKRQQALQSLREKVVQELCQSQRPMREKFLETARHVAQSEEDPTKDQ